MALAPARSNIIYKVERAEVTNFADDTFDIITVGQAAHWFDHASFNKEVKRTLKPDGVIAIWSYDLLRISPEIDAVIDAFYHDVVGSFWTEERRHVESRYEHIPFDFSDVCKATFVIEDSWMLAQLEGYLNTWSSVQQYRKKNPGSDPASWVMKKVIPLWEDHSHRNVSFPVFMKTGTVKKSP